MSLQNLQLEFIEALFNEQTSTTLAVQPKNNLNIYRNNIQSTLIETLQEIYPLIVKLVGQDFFRLTAQEYIKRYPSRSGDLHEYGAYFSDFLAEFEPLHDLIYLVEVAQFEWICHTLYSAPDHPDFDRKKLADISPDNYDQLHFSVNPASQLRRFYYPILRIVDLCKKDAAQTLDVDAGGANLLIIRSQTDLSLIPLTHAEFTFLDMLSEGKSVSESLNTACLLDNTFNLEKKLPEWIQDKIIIDCY